MGFKTGRSRTLDIHGGFSGDFRVANFPPISGPCGPAGSGVPGTYSTISARVVSNSMVADWHLTGPTADGAGDFWWGLTVSARIDAFCGITGVASGATNNFVWGGYPVCDVRFPHSFALQTNALSGTYSMQLTVDEYVSIADSGAFPSFGGSPAEDMPNGTTFTLYELPRIGTAVTVTINVNGVIATATGTVTVQDAIAYNLSGVANAAQASFSKEAADVHTTGIFLNAGLGVAYSRTNQDVTALASGLDFSVAVASGTVVNQTGTITIGGGQPKSYDLTGVIRSWGGSYPDALTLKVQRSSVDPTHAFNVTGTFSDSNTQYQYSVSSSLNGIPEGDVTKSSISVNEYADLKMWIDPASLTTAKEDPSDWRVMMRGNQFAGLGISQSASLVVDDGGAVSVAAGNYKGDWTASVATISSVAGEIKIICGAGAGSTASRSFTTASPGSGFSGYRYLRLKIRADADGRAFSFNLGSKSYAVDYAGAALQANIAAGTLYIDLCAQTATSDSTDTKWPLPTVDGPLWGVTGATLLQLLALVSSATYYIDEIALCRHPSSGSSKVSFQPAFTQWMLEHPPSTVGDTTTTDYARRSLQGDTDGRLSVEELDYRKTVVAGPMVTTTTYAANSIASMIGATNAAGSAGSYPAPNNPGWTATGSTSAVDPADGGDFSAWLNCNRPAHWLYGAGALYAKIAPDTLFGWYFGLDLDANSAHDIPAQMVFDVLSWYPGCTDPFGYTDGPTAGVLYVHAAKIMRGQSWGLVADASGAAAGQMVSLKKTSTQAQEASGTSDAKGEYFTGSTWAREGEQYDTVGPTDYVRRVMAGRYRYRACFGPIGGSYVAYDVSDASRHYRAYVATNGHISVGVASNLLALTWNDRDSGITGTVPCIGIERTSKRQRLYLSYIDGGAAGKLAYSDNEGVSWSAAVTIASSVKHLRFCLTRHGTRHFMWVTAGGAIQGLVMDSQSNTLVSTFTAVASGVDDDAIDVREFQGAKGEHRIGLAYRSGGNLIFVSAKDARTFS